MTSNQILKTNNKIYYLTRDMWSLYIFSLKINNFLINVVLLNSNMP